jgi:hypothetical protein
VNNINKPSLIYYTVKLEADVPTLIEYKILASSPEEALEKIKTSNAIESVKPILPKMKRKNAKVYKRGTIEIQASKRY